LKLWHKNQPGSLQPIAGSFVNERFEDGYGDGGGDMAYGLNGGNEKQVVGPWFHKKPQQGREGEFAPLSNPPDPTKGLDCGIAQGRSDSALKGEIAQVGGCSNNRKATEVGGDGGTHSRVQALNADQTGEQDWARSPTGNQLQSP
jgi:hypothetical protein